LIVVPDALNYLATHRVELAGTASYVAVEMPLEPLVVGEVELATAVFQVVVKVAYNKRPAVPSNFVQYSSISSRLV